MLSRGKKFIFFKGCYESKYFSIENEFISPLFLTKKMDDFSKEINIKILCIDILNLHTHTHTYIYI